MEEYLKQRGMSIDYFKDKNITKVNLIDSIADSLNNKLSFKTRLLFTISELMSFISQFQYKIQIDNGSLIPINYINFALLGSGVGKDSSFSILENMFENGYSIIKTFQDEINETRADSLSVSEKDKKDLLLAIPNKKVSTSTNEGIIKYINSLELLGLGNFTLYVNELGSELLSSQNIMNNMQLLSEVYDEGKKVEKLISGNTKNKAINNLAFNGLFIGSPDNILLEDSATNSLKRELLSKLSRRSTILYDSTIDQIVDKTPEQIIKEYSDINKDLLSVRSKLSQYILL